MGDALVRKSAAARGRDKCDGRHNGAGAVAPTARGRRCAYGAEVPTARMRRCANGAEVPMARERTAAGRRAARALRAAPTASGDGLQPALSRFARKGCQRPAGSSQAMLKASGWARRP